MGLSGLLFPDCIQQVGLSGLCIGGPIRPQLYTASGPIRPIRLPTVRPDIHLRQLKGSSTAVGLHLPDVLLSRRARACYLNCAKIPNSLDLRNLFKLVSIALPVVKASVQ